MLLILKIYRLGEMVAFAFFKYGRNVQNIDFFWNEASKRNGTIQSIYTNPASESQLNSTYAIGFTSSDFIIWTLRVKQSNRTHLPYELAF
jgi:hypothetical protein